METKWKHEIGEELEFRVNYKEFKMGDKVNITSQTIEIPSNYSGTQLFGYTGFKHGVAISGRFSDDSYLSNHLLKRTGIITRPYFIY